MALVLSIQNLSVAYARKGLALDNVSLSVPEGGIVALLGANGAGKTTLIRAVTGLLDLHHGSIQGGRIEFLGQSIQHTPAHRLFRMGMGQVPEGRMVFKHLTVEENLRVGAAALSRHEFQQGLETVYALFPRLRERQKQAAGLMSGGEQQMLAIGRGLMAEPRLLILDEPSLGLSPLLVEELFALIQQLRTQGLAILLVEQNVAQSLDIADRAYVIENGTLRFSGNADQLMASDELRKSYLGV